MQAAHPLDHVGQAPGMDNPFPVPEDELEHITSLACDLFGVSAAAVSLISDEQLIFQAVRGIDLTSIRFRNTPCAIAAKADEPYIVEDAANDADCAGLAAIRRAGVRFYAGVRLRTSEGETIGVLAVMDTKPRAARHGDADRLLSLAKLTCEVLDARRLSAELRTQRRELDETENVLVLNEQLGRIIDHSFNEIYIFEIESLHIIAANRTARFNLGYGEKELQDMSASALQAEQGGADLEAMIEPLRSGDKTHIFCRGAHTRRDGSTYPMEGVIERSTFGGREVFVGIVADISDKIASERLLELANRQLVQSEERFRRIYRETPAMMYSLTRDRRFIDASDAFLDLIGYERDDLIGRPINDIITAESERKAQSEILPRFWSDGCCKDVAYQYITKSGKTVDVEFSALLIPDSDGPEDPAIHTVVTDVTARNRAQFELGVRERQFRAVLSDTPGLLARFLPDTTVTFINPTFCRLLECNEDDAHGRRLTDLIPPRHAEALLRNITGLNVGDPDYSFEQKSKDAAGQTHFHWWIMRGYFNEAGELVEVQLAGRDITEIKQMQMELAANNTLLEQINADLMRANESLNQFAYIASHDLQEPLRKISTFVSLLKRAVDMHNEEEIDLAIPIIVESVHRARELVSDILTYSRISNSEISREPVKLRHVIQDAKETFSEAISEAGAEIEEHGLDIEVRADRRQLTNLIHNMLSNAIKYRSPERQPKIVISVRHSPGTGAVVLEFSDNGIGIETAHRKTIFEPFRRLHSRAQYPGTGIGLAICDTVVQRHGWSIEVDSDPGLGTTFRITMPGEHSLALAS